MNTLRVPPNSIEAEESILGAAMLDNKITIDIIQQIEQQDFYSLENQAIFEAISHLNSLNKPIDIITVSEELKALNKLEDVGGLEHLSELVTNIITTANIKTYIQMVRSKSIRRKFINACMTIINYAYDGVYETISDFKADALKQIDIPIGEKTSITIREITETVMQNIDERCNQSGVKLPYGLMWLDKVTGGAHNTDLTIIAARPSVGKTSLAMQFGLNFARKNNHVGIFSLEMGSDQLVERLIANEGLIHLDRLRYPKNIQDSDFIKLGQAVAYINNLNLHIYDDIFKVESIRAKCMELKVNGNLDVVIIDYLQLVESIHKKSSENERIGYISRQLKMLAKELRVPVILLSQLTRENEKDNRRPKLTDLRSSGSIEQDADNVIFLHDANYGNYEQEQTNNYDVELIIAKQRNGLRDIYTNIKFYKDTQRWEG